MLYVQSPLSAYLMQSTAPGSTFLEIHPEQFEIKEICVGLGQATVITAPHAYLQPSSH